MLTDKELQSLRNLGNEAEAAADEIVRLRAEVSRLRSERDAAVAAERERCAKLCEQEHRESGEHPEMALHCAERIRGLRI